TGWGKNDTHAGPSNLQYGFDNKIWGVLGYSGFNGTIDGKTWRFPQGVYHFDPDGKNFEYLASTSNNTWGLGFTEDNHVFISDLTGWGKNDTHAGPSNLQYGFDNKIWGVLGYSGFNGTIDGKTWRFPQGVYHFDPDGKNFEYLASTSNNTWGLGFTEDNHVFI